MPPPSVPKTELTQKMNAYEKTTKATPATTRQLPVVTPANLPRNEMAGGGGQRSRRGIGS